MTAPPDKPDENSSPPPDPASGWWPLNKLVWTIVGLVAAAAIFLVGMISSGTTCKDATGVPTACRSGGGHGGGSSSSWFGGGSSASTMRGGFGSTGGAHSGGGGE